MNAHLTRWGQCKALTLKPIPGTERFYQCLNPATGPEGRCFVLKHKAEINVGKGVQDQLPSPIRDSGAPMDMDMPLEPIARKAYLRDIIAQTKENN